MTLELRLDEVVKFSYGVNAPLMVLRICVSVYQSVL